MSRHDALPSLREQPDVPEVSMGDVLAVFHLDPEAIRCPYPHFDKVREEQPVVFLPEIDCWLVTRYADIVQVGRDPHTFSSVMPTGPVLARQQSRPCRRCSPTNPS